MNCILKRIDYLEDGIFGELDAADDSFTFMSLEHAYPVNQGDGITWAPKVPKGVYTCQRGSHELAGMDHAFETFEVMNVPGHTGILIHPGNTEADSEGCILIGMARTGSMVIQSRNAFEAFMKAQDGINQFTLTVE